MRLRRLEPVLRVAFRGPCALARGSRILVATSGGADSTALLAALASLSGELGLELVAAHLHHGLRGADADADQALVREQCARLGVPLVTARMHGRERMQRDGLRGEAGLRTLRRRFLLRSAQRARCAFIATAHTADDQLETLLMRLARGTGLAGLGGMRARHGVWLKPLLAATRADIEHDLVRAKLAWREDASNASREFLRNRIRHDVVPALARAAAPDQAPASARSALALRAVAAALEADAGWRVVHRSARSALKMATGDPLAQRLDLRVLARRPLAVRAAALRRFWKRVNPATSGLTRAHLDALLGRVESPGRRARVALPDGWRAAVSGGWLEISPPAGRAGALASREESRRDARLRRDPSIPSPTSTHAARLRASADDARPIPMRARPASRLERHD